MDLRLGKFSDRQIALMLGSLNTGEISMKTRLLCEASYRLARAGGAALTEVEDDLIDEIMTCEFRLRENQRKQRRCKSNSVRKGGRGESPEPFTRRSRSNASASSPLRLVVKQSL
jgi:hypothetical protein